MQQKDKIKFAKLKRHQKQDLAKDNKPWLVQNLIQTNEVKFTDVLNQAELRLLALAVSRGTLFDDRNTLKTPVMLFSADQNQIQVNTSSEFNSAYKLDVSHLTASMLIDEIRSFMKLEAQEEVFVIVDGLTMFEETNQNELFTYLVENTKQYNFTFWGNTQ